MEPILYRHHDIIVSAASELQVCPRGDVALVAEMSQVVPNIGKPVVDSRKQLRYTRQSEAFRGLELGGAAIPASIISEELGFEVVS